MRSSLALLAAFGLVACADAPSPSPAAPTSAPAAQTPAPDAATTPPASQPDPIEPPPRMGANVQPGGVMFRVWAPNASKASLLGDFPEGELAMASEGNGVFGVLVASAHAGTTYHFALDTAGGRLERIDPYCREIVSGTSCKVIDPGAYAWKAPTFTKPSRTSAVVYEMHVGSFAVAQGGKQGTFARAKDELASVADLGVNVVELMPVHAFGGNPNGWGYNPQLFLAPKPTYGTSDDLRAFVDEAHRLGIAVWVDVVWNHTDGWKQAPLYCFDGRCPDGTSGIYFFPKGDYAYTPWGPRPNYVEPEVVAMLRASTAQWLVEYRGDGFRVDSVSNIRALDGNGNTPGGKDLLVAMNELTHKGGGLAVAEDLKGWDAITKKTSDGGFGFDAQWDGFGYDVTGMLAGFSDDARDVGVVERALRGGYAGDPFARLLWTENHDTVGNGGARLPNKIDPANPTSIAARRRSMLGAALLMTTPGVPMLFMGQESLATGGFTDPPSPLAPPAQGAKVRAFYKDLIALRRNLGGGAGGLSEPGVEILHRNDDAKVIAWRRHGASGQDVVVVANLRNRAYTRYDVGAPSAGAWRVRLNSERTAYGDDLSDGQSGVVSTLAQAKDGKPNLLPLQLAPYSVMILTK